MASLKHLFSPIRIGTMGVKNRLVMPPMGINFGVDEEGCVTDQLKAYFEARAKGGTGMMIVGGAAVHPTGLDLPKLPRIWADEHIPAFREMTDVIHQYDVKFGIQLLHGGRQCYHGKGVAPSPLPAQGVVKGTPRELTIPEIGELVEAFGDSARRSEEAGFDFVEIHGAHGYLITEFLALNSNKRRDEYGGSFENRIRFLLEVLRDIGKKTNSGFPVGVRINGDDFIKDGWVIEDAKRIAPILEQEGAAYLHVTAGIYGSYPPGISIPSMYADQGVFIHLAEEVKQTVSIPVIGVGRIKDPEHADRIIKEGRADMVSMGRAHLADPDLANKAKSGNLADIRPCLGCCLGCVHNVFQLEAATCVMNPEVNREYLLKGLKKVATPKKILVVGAGPSGLAVSRLAAIRGHKVIVCDEKGDVGGMLRLASIPPGRSEFMELIHYYKKELNNLRVEIRLNIDIDDDLVDSIEADTVVLATGSLPEMPQLEGIFDTDMNIHTVVEVLKGNVSLGDRVLIFGGNQMGLETADFVAEKEKEVVVLHREGHFALEMAANDRVFLIERLKRPNVKLYKGVSIKEFLPKGVLFQARDKEIRLERFEDMVLSEGSRSIRTLADFFKRKGLETHIIGDAKKPRSLLESQSEADELGRSI
ncbi:MAG: FAD-dependent oxidoreductase [Deltaproteobacteria bacterium]|nr:FAD-dependent oxidoreductase [Deltaproteobacteria bacterium]